MKLLLIQLNAYNRVGFILFIRFSAIFMLSGANIVKFSEYNQYNYQSSKSFPHKSISDGAFHKLHPTNSPIANKKSNISL